MNRNSEARFHSIPRANIQRAAFDRSYSNITTINEGDIVPIYVDEMLPGDTVKLKLSSLVRMATPLYPVMDNAKMDVYYFFVPSRILWEHWVNLMGENTESYWAPKTEYTTPKTTAPKEGWNVGTIADYMGIPTGVPNIKVNSLPFRAYCKIYNDWFRDENLVQPAVLNIDDATESGSNGSDPIADAIKGGMPLKAAKYHDYFTSTLPGPLKATEPVTIGLAGIAAVKTSAEATVTGAQPAATYANANYGYIPDYDAPLGLESNTGKLAYFTGNGTPSSLGAKFYPNNLYADLSEGTSITVEQLRQAVAIQHILEADARGGTRYTEILNNQFGVTSPDARLQRSEYIGGTRMNININQVIQNSGTTDTSPQGNTAAYSLTTNTDKICTYSATEHGFILGLAVVRVEHSYQQGLARMWTRSDRFSYYHPMLANLGEMAVYNQEIYAQGTAEDEEVFGYQEAWADYRYHPNTVTGEMRSTAPQPLDAWHYADYYTELPKLSSSWIAEGTENIDRTLAVQSESNHQFIANFYFVQKWVRPMPVYSIPGLKTL